VPTLKKKPWEMGSNIRMEKGTSKKVVGSKKRSEGKKLGVECGMRGN
jgi:hypothetical protein